jgi:hypothetical protein
MTEDGPEAASGGPDGPEGVFGNLPSTRPGSRSPRRRSTEEKQVAADPPSEGPSEESVPSTPARENPPDSSRGTDPPTPEPEPDPDPPLPDEDPLAPQPSIQGVEDLAWAGVAVVAQAATAGIRFTSKALEAARKSIDRP